MSTEQMVNQLVANIRAELGRARRTQGQAAKVLGISGPQMSARMNGTVGFKVNEVFEIAEWLDIPVSRLIEGQPIDGYVGHLLQDRPLVLAA